MVAAADSGPHVFDRYEYCSPNQILTLWDADEQYDRQGGEEREVWGQIGIGSKEYVAAVEGLHQ
jgi:hypothetical protein